MEPTPRTQSGRTRVIAFLVVGLVAASQSGNIVRLGHAPAVSIAAWRLVLACALLAPLAGRRLRQLLALSARERWLLVGAGVALAGHLITWIAAVQRTTVANAALFFSINPVLTAAAAHWLFGERVGPRLLVSIGLGLAGVVVIGLGDLQLGAAGTLQGDALALLCALLFSAYFLLGKRLRQKLDNTVYVVGVYGVAGAVSFGALLALGLPVVDYDSQTWLCFGLMALVPTVIGHSGLNYALRTLDASRVSAATLSEPALAGAVAAFAWGEPISAPAAAGYALIAASVLVLVLERRGTRKV